MDTHRALCRAMGAPLRERDQANEAVPAGLRRHALSVEGPTRSAWDALSRDDEFALWRTLWLARFRNTEQEVADLRARLNDVTLATERYLDKRTYVCDFSEVPGPDTMGVATAMGGLCADTECECLLVCTAGCSGRWYRDIGTFVPLRAIPRPFRCSACMKYTHEPWVQQTLLGNVRRRYWPADMPVPSDTPAHLL